MHSTKSLPHLLLSFVTTSVVPEGNGCKIVRSVEGSNAPETLNGGDEVYGVRTPYKNLNNHKSIV